VLLVLMIVRTVRHLATRSRRAVPAEV
jgi:hypothetical protein